MKPKPLNKGDKIAFIAPSSGLSALFTHRLDNATKYLENEGYQVVLFPTVSKIIDGKAGNVQDRVKDLEDAFTDKSIKAIICAIGGLSCNELINEIDYKKIKNNPKIFCGYSDITILHYAIQKKTNLTTFYGPAAMTQFGEYPKTLEYTEKHFEKAVTEQIGEIKASDLWTDELLDWSEKKDLERPRELKPNKGYIWLKKGEAKGKIIGGCLSSIMQLSGTEFNISYKDKILFIETPEGQDFTKGEPLNYVDSQLMDLRNLGVFDQIKGLIVGKPFGYTNEEQKEFENLIKEHTNKYDFPVLINVNIGHTDPIITIPLMVECKLDSKNNEFSIIESGVELFK